MAAAPAIYGVAAADLLAPVNTLGNNAAHPPARMVTHARLSAPARHSAASPSTAGGALGVGAAGLGLPPNE